MNDEDKIKQLVQLVKDLWEVRGYGIPEMELHQRVVDAVELDKSEFYLVGMRPIGPDGLSWVPEIKDGKISYTHHFEVPHE